MRLVSAGEIAVDVMAQIHDEGQRNHHNILRLVTRACRQMNMKYNPSIRTEMFEFSENMTVTLPEKSVKPIKIAKLSDDLKTCEGMFEITGDLYTDSQLDGCSCAGEAEETCAVHTFHSCCWGPYSYGTMCWPGSRLYIGQVRWKPENSTLYFTSHYDVGDHVLIEYEVMDDTQGAMIPEILRETIIQRVLMWFHMERRPQVSMMHERLFRIELHEAKRLADPLTYEDYIKALRGSYSPITVFTSKPKAVAPITKTYTIVTPDNNPDNIPGPYTDDEEALQAGLFPGDEYYLDSDNPWGHVFGLVKVIGE